MNIEELRAQWANRVARLEALNALATGENRELTDNELGQATVLRSQITELTADIERADHPTNAAMNAASVQRSSVEAQAAYGGRNLNNPLGNPVDDPTSIQRVAADIAQAVGERQSISRAITMPVGYTSGDARGGDPTDVMDLAQFFLVGPITGSSHDVVVIDGTPGQIVAEGQPKPDIITATLAPAPTKKIAGMGQATSEVLIYVGGATRLLNEVLRESIIAGQNAEIASTIEADGDAFAFATSGLNTILAASAKISTKSTATVAIVNSADFAGLAIATASLPQTLPVPRFVISDDITAGKAVIAARSAVEVARTRVMVLIDPYTLAHVNTTRLVAEMFVSVNVIRPDLALVAALA